MHFLDYLVFVIYMLGVLGVGFYFYRKNANAEDYYVGNRSISPTHVGVSIVATDVGGGFSIGLGGLGFAMGLSGSWLLFTGLVGAWLSAVFIIPKIKAIDQKHSMLTYPDFLRYRYNGKVALVAAIISGIGYMGFTGAQVLAGATLADATIINRAPFGMNATLFALLLMGLIIIAYTVLGGLKAVIYTDTVQWIILLVGLIFLAAPFAVHRIGGWNAMKSQLPEGFLSLRNISWVTYLNWMVTIIPIWLVGMTLYQRMYACKDVKDAKRAWYIAGFFEYPIMAFTGVFLGMCARVLFPEVLHEQGLPLLIKSVLPVGIAGLVVVAYFSAIMSTADSCLMASSGNFVNDILQRYFMKDAKDKTIIRASQIVTLLVGLIAILLATLFTTVLDGIMYAYAFMVSGLFVPTMAAYFLEKPSSTAAFWSMISGGGFTLIVQISALPMPLGLDASLFGIVVSAVVFSSLSLVGSESISFAVGDLLPSDENCSTG